MLFVRFNPDACRVDGALIKVSKSDRHSRLCQKLRELCRPRTQAKLTGGELQIHYLYYDSETIANGKLRPCIVRDAEWPAGLEECIASTSDVLL